MKTLNKTLMVTAASLALLASPAFATKQPCASGEVCGLDLDIDVNTSKNIDGLGGIDLSDVEVKADGEITVEVPELVDNAVEISQKNTGEISSNLNYYGSWIAGDFESKVTAIANNASIETQGSTAVEAVQDNSGEVSANSKVLMEHLVAIQSVDLSSTAVGNNLGITSTGDLVLDTIQNNTNGVYATIDARLQGQASVTTADVNVAATAIGNNLSGTHDGVLVGSMVQENCGDVVADAKVNVYGFYDPITATAVGNNISISLPK